MSKQLEREEEEIEKAYERGEITAQEMQRELNDLYRAYNAAAEDAAQEAYNATLDDWGVGRF